MLLSGEKSKKCVEGIIHEETQVSDRGVDLTVNCVSRSTSPTNLDFGGGEEDLGEIEKLSPEKKSEDDKYGWWNLEGGIYIIDFNEEINVTEGLGMVAPLERLTEGGSFHTGIVFTGKLKKRPVLYVNPSGLNLKENARISRLSIWR